tara:strand:- start:1985 stop:3658 length:1674 start_codon:yes stop_codon:yes gene_type:complete
VADVRSPQQNKAFTEIPPEAFTHGFNDAFPSSSDVLDAAYDLSKIDTTLNSIDRMIELDKIEAQESEVVDPVELNKEFPGLPTPFTKPTKRAVAEEIYKRHKERVELGGVLSRAQDDPFLSTGTFAASLIPHAIDPINLAADLTVGGALLGIGRGVMGARSVMTARRAFMQGAAEGVLGNLATEPFTFAANQMELQDYSVAQAMVNVAAGGVFFPAVRFGLNQGSALVKRFGSNHVEAVGQSALSQASAGRRVDVNPLIRDFHIEAGGSPRWAPEYRYSPTNITVGRKFYAGTNHSFPNLKENTVLIDTDLGDGIYLSDSPGVANGISARKLGSKTGKVLEVDLSEARLIDLDAPITPSVKAALEPLVREVLGQKRFDSLETRPGRELFDEVRDAVESGKATDELVAKANKALEEAGYDGYRYETGQQGGDKSNGVMLFNDSKATTSRAIKPDLAAVRRASDEELQSIVERNQDFKSEWTYDDAAYKDFQEMDELPVDVETREIQASADEALEELAEIERIGALDEAQIRELEVLREAKREAEVADQMVNFAYSCLR